MAVRMCAGSAYPRTSVERHTLPRHGEATSSSASCASPPPAAAHVCRGAYETRCYRWQPFLAVRRSNCQRAQGRTGLRSRCTRPRLCSTQRWRATASTSASTSAKLRCRRAQSASVAPRSSTRCGGKTNLRTRPARSSPGRSRSHQMGAAAPLKQVQRRARMPNISGTAWQSSRGEAGPHPLALVITPGWLALGCGSASPSFGAVFAFACTSSGRMPRNVGSAYSACSASYDERLWKNLHFRQTLCVRAGMRGCTLPWHVA